MVKKLLSQRPKDRPSAEGILELSAVQDEVRRRQQAEGGGLEGEGEDEFAVADDLLLGTILVKGTCVCVCVCVCVCDEWSTSNNCRLLEP